MQPVDVQRGSWHPWLSFREAAFKVWEKSGRTVRSTLAKFRPRVSLFSGAVFVLLTLFLPIAYNSCGPEKTGIEFIGGASGDFPLLAGMYSQAFGRGFYALSILFAGFTLILVVVSWFQPWVFRGHRWVTSLYGASGTISLYILGDAVCFMLGWLAGTILDSTLQGDETRKAVGFGLILVLAALCLRSKFLRSSRLILALLTAAIFGCLLVIAKYFSALFFPGRHIPDWSLDRQLIILENLYWFLPAYLWYRFGLRQRPSGETPWPNIRSTILKVYLPALVCVPILFWLVADEHVWGFIPFSIGIHLMSLGYMQLARTTQDGGVVVATTVSPARAASI